MMRLTSFALFAILFLPSAVWADDPLDEVTGTERWREGASSDPREEWRDWLRARAAWRAARRTLRIEAARNRQLAALLRRARPRGSAVRKVMQGRPKAGRRKVPTHGVRIKRGSADEDEDEDEDEGSKVPVERLDDRGEVIDEEGDQLFKRPVRRRR